MPTAVDFDRNGYTDVLGSSGEHVLHTSPALGSAWDMATDDPALAMRWQELEHSRMALSAAASPTSFARGSAWPGSRTRCAEGSLPGQNRLREARLVRLASLPAADVAATSGFSFTSV